MTCNDKDLEQAIFILVGILGLETFPCWIAIQLCSMRVLTLLGNCTMLLIIKTEVSLLTPMYFFLSMLAINDPLIITSTLPKMLSILRLDSQLISFNTCLLQLYFTHTSHIIKSGTPLATACVPTLRLPYCFQQVIPRTHCKPTAGVKLACADTGLSQIYGISVALLVVGLDMILVATTYSVILRVVFTLLLSEANGKALATCTAYLCTLLVLCTSPLFTFLTHCINRDMPPYSHILLVSIYLLVLPLVNPLVCGMKTKKIRDRVSNIVNHGQKTAAKP
ncbi:olfactory receptor 52B2-like [Gopherus evgoodei]|uniref:olfactory receptor 52B2-like n=1 Tax=Gopherus evgoodei TaxID=1825980 RepID=UPI0011CFD265|nr:olfactory receptor 52B2-like [Gopherus evgoodei]